MHNKFSDVVELDKNDSFKALTELFDMPVTKKGKQAIYLNGNSLGPKPKCFDEGLIAECKAWADNGVRGQFDGAPPWITYTDLVTKSLANLTGAKPEEVVATGTLTANLHFCFVSFYRPTKERYKVIRLLGFPSDTYAIDSQVTQRLETLNDFGVDAPYTVEDAVIEIKPDERGYIDLETFKKVIAEHGSSSCLIWLEGVHYQTGQYFNIPEIVKLAQKQGCKVGLDLAHAIGNVPLSLHDWGVDFAVWCSYKYLSGGPGTIGGLYVHEKYIRDEMTKFNGWWGHNKVTRYEMPKEFDPIPTVESWQVSNPSIMLIAGLHQSLSLFDNVDFNALVEKNKRLVSYLYKLINAEVSENIQIITPHDPNERGCQLSLRIHGFKDIELVENMLWDEGVICDVRGDLLRVAPMGLYSTFTDAYRFVEKLQLIFDKLT